MRPWLVGLVAALLLVGCAAAPTGSPAGRDGLTIAVTTSVLGDVVGELAGDAATVEVLMPPGADPHAFALSAARAEQLRDADLVVSNGLGLEEGMLDALAAAEADGVRVVAAADLVPSRVIDRDEDDHDHGHDHADGDPHIWFDAGLMAEVVEALAAELATIDPDGAEGWTQRGAALADRYRDLDAEVRDLLAAVPPERRVLVTNHDSFAYFARAYDFEVVGTVLPGGGTLGEASAAELERLAELVEQHGIDVLFTEEGTSSQVVEAVAREVGPHVTVVPLPSDALSDPDGEAGTYEAYLRTTATRIAEALS